MKLYVPGRGDPYAYPALAPALTRPVRWEIIENNYDLMMKYATAIRLRTASTEALWGAPRLPDSPSIRMGVWKGEVIASTEEELLSGIQG